MYQRDPDNRLLARGPRYRLQAEALRDNALAISGLLVDKIGGPSVMPYQPAGLWEELAGGAHDDYTQGHGDDLYRRSLYTYRKRTVPHPSMATFDAPSWEICQVKRAAHQHAAPGARAAERRDLYGGGAETCRADVDRRRQLGRFAADVRVSPGDEPYADAERTRYAALELAKVYRPVSAVAGCGRAVCQPRRVASQQIARRRRSGRPHGRRQHALEYGRDDFEGLIAQGLRTRIAGDCYGRHRSSSSAEPATFSAKARARAWARLRSVRSWARRKSDRRGLAVRCSRSIRAAAAFSAQGEAGHLPVSVRRPVAIRPVRLQAEAAASCAARTCRPRSAWASGSRR